MPVTRYDLNLCNGCGKCVNSCSRDVFRLNDTKKKSVIAYPQDCDVCGLCALYCPTGSIIMTPEHLMWPMTAFR
jgi:NAD-dependent dihydropyrimidine dehydrogenase PreA subunit